MSAVGLQVFTPSMVKADMISINNAVDALAKDIVSAGNAMDTRFREEYGKFALEWREFYAQHDTWLKRAFNKTAELTEQFKRRVIDWRNEFQKRGGISSSPVLRQYPEDSFTLGRVALVAGIALGGFLLYKAATRRDETRAFVVG